MLLQMGLTTTSRTYPHSSSRIPTSGVPQSTHPFPPLLQPDEEMKYWSDEATHPSLLPFLVILPPSTGSYKAPPLRFLSLSRKERTDAQVPLSCP